MKKIAICDDNDLQREILHEMLNEYFHRIYQKAEIVEYGRGDIVAADMEDGDLDVSVIFLDIYMPGMNGIETARRLRELGCHAEIIFLTASSEHALESYEVEAAGYLVKPVDMERLSNLLNHIFWTDAKRRIEIKCGRQYRYPYIHEIMYVESMGHRVTLHLTDGTTIETTDKIKTMQERIDDFHFLQCHQSYLVNMNYVADIQNHGEEIVLSNGERVPISVRRRTETVERYHRFFRGVLH